LSRVCSPGGSGENHAQLTLDGWKSAVAVFCRCATTARRSRQPQRGRDAGDGAARCSLDVALGARDLAGEPRPLRSAQAQFAVEQAGRVDERVAVHDAVTEPLRVREPRQTSERFALRRPRQARLKADQVEGAAGDGLFAQLHDGVGGHARHGVAQADGFHRPEAQHVVAAVGHLLDRQATLEVRRTAGGGVGLELLGLVARQFSQVAHEPRVLLAVERNVEVVVAVAPLVARLAIHLRLVERVGRHDG
jgi:hypothetical protein